jgi:hypothetical protein
MTDLKTQVEESANKLEEGHRFVTNKTSGTFLPLKCYERWKENAVFYRHLQLMAPLFITRDKAWEMVRLIADKRNMKDPEKNIIRLNEVDMDFSIARHLNLTSYMTTTWTIYDRLANICGRLGATDALGQNPRQNPKICEDFLGTKFHLGFSLQFHLIQSYSWPIKVSYKLRNWLVHEGYEEGLINMFRGSDIDDNFILHPNTMDYLENCCKTNNERPSCIDSEDAFPWYDQNLLTILPKYHNEIDIMFTSLLKWCVDAFLSQITSFAERDRS